MKVKLLKKLRRQAREVITIYSVTKTNGDITGMRYVHDGDYSGLFSFGNTENDVLKKAAKIFFEKNMPIIRERYKKYSAKYKTQPLTHK